MSSWRRRLFQGVADPASAEYRRFPRRAELGTAAAATVGGDELVDDVKTHIAASSGPLPSDWSAVERDEAVGDFSICRRGAALEGVDAAFATSAAIRHLQRAPALMDRVALVHAGRCQQQQEQQQPQQQKEHEHTSGGTSFQRKNQRTSPSAVLRDQPNVSPTDVSDALGLPVYVNSSNAPPTWHHPRNLQAFFQSGQRTVLDALTRFGDYFFAGFATNDTSSSIDTSPFKIRRFVGGANPADGGFGESNLDSQYLLGISLGVPTWAFSYPDGDFCADLLRWSSDVLRLVADANETYPLVISLSYAVQDAPSYCPASALTRLDDDAVLMGLAGITVVAASGDYGPGLVGLAGWNFGFFSPAVPASLPGFLAVGATQINTTVCASSYSGGGFSAVFNNSDAGAHRNAAVAAYLHDAGTAAAARLAFNGSMRSTPDVAAPGTNFDAFIQGLTTISGTSASTPVIAGLISRLNDVSLETIGQPLGHVGQFFDLAARRGCFHDTTTAAAGFEGASANAAWPPAPGWDACSGYGVPQYPCLASLVKELAAAPGAERESSQQRHANEEDVVAAQNATAHNETTLDQVWRVELPANRVLSVPPAHFREAGIVMVLLEDGSAVGINVTTTSPSIAWRNVADDPSKAGRQWLPTCAILAADAARDQHHHHHNHHNHNASDPVAVAQSTAGILRIHVTEGWTVWELPRAVPIVAVEASHCLALVRLPPTVSVADPAIVAVVGFVFSNDTVTIINAATGGPRIANVTIQPSLQPALPVVPNSESFLATTVNYPYDRDAGPALAPPALHWNASACTPQRCSFFASLVVYRHHHQQQQQQQQQPGAANSAVVVAVAFDFAAGLRNCTGRRIGEVPLAGSSSSPPSPFFATSVTAMGVPGDGSTRVLLQGLVVTFSTPNVAVRTVDAVKSAALFNPTADQPFQWALAGSAPLAVFPSRDMMIAPIFDGQPNAVQLWRWSGNAAAGGYIAAPAVQLCDSQGVVSCGAVPGPLSGDAQLAFCTCVDSGFGNTSLYGISIAGSQEGPATAQLQLLGAANVAAPSSLSRPGVLSAGPVTAAGHTVNVATARGSYSVGPFNYTTSETSAKTWLAIRSMPMLEPANGFSLGAVVAEAGEAGAASSTGRCDLTAASLGAVGCWAHRSTRR